MFGFDHFPFRVAAFILMGANLLLAYNLLRILADSREAALAATFLLSYNVSFLDLYQSTGTIYDILCLGFFVASFRLYLSARREPERFGIKKLGYALDSRSPKV